MLLPTFFMRRSINALYSNVRDALMQGGIDWRAAESAFAARKMDGEIPSFLII